MTSSTPSAPDPNAPAPSDRLWLRSELMGTQVITRDTGRRLGVVGEVVVDIDRREVVALGLRDNPLTRFLPGLPRWMPLERIRQVGDVILVDSADSLDESFNPERYSKVINCQVITESGAQLGRVLGFSFDVETGELTTLVIGALGVPLLGEGVLSTWELAVGEIVSSGTDRIIVYEGAEEKLKQLGTGLLEKLGIGGSSWEQEERERFRSSSAVPAENQLPAGQPAVVEQRRIQPASSRVFRPEQELDYVELEERREREPLRQRRYLDEPEPEPEPRFRRDADREADREAMPERRRESYAPRESESYPPSPRSERYPERRDERYADYRDERPEGARDDRYGEARGERYGEGRNDRVEEPRGDRLEQGRRERYGERYGEPRSERYPDSREPRSDSLRDAPDAAFQEPRGRDLRQERFSEPRDEPDGESRRVRSFSNDAAAESPRQALEPRRSRAEPPAPDDEPIAANGVAAPRPVDVEAEPLDDPW